MNKKIFLVALLIVIVGIVIYFFTIEQSGSIQKENHTQENHSSELLGIKNTSPDTQNSSINITQTTPPRQNLSANISANINKNETYNRIYRYVLKIDTHGKLSEANITIYTKEELINNTMYIVAESKLDDVPNGFLYSKNFYETIEYMNAQTGDIKLVIIPYEITTDGKLRSIPEDKREYEFPSDILYSNTFNEKTEEDYLEDYLLTIYDDIDSEISILHPLYLIGFGKFEPENVTITEKRDVIDVTPVEVRNVQNCSVQYKDDGKKHCYCATEIFNISYTKNSTKGIIIQKNYTDKKPLCSVMDHNLTADYLEKEVEKEKMLSIETIRNINFLGTEIFRGIETYKIEEKLKQKTPYDLFESDTSIWIDKKDKTILFMNSSAELHGFAKYSTIYERINESIVKK